MPDTPDVSIIVPALNEAQNLPELLRRVDAAMAGRAYEVIVVDDNSADDTRAVAAALSGSYPLRLHVRAEPRNGLSGAVLDGMALARGNDFVVMDADLQHPPERIVDLLASLNDGQTDFALGSRYVAGGTTAETWSPLRRINSRLATALARPFAGGTSDPMSGFFALPRRVYERAERLTPLGYKVGLELMCKGRAANVVEVPIHFDTRARGTSKLTLTQQFKYLEHLSRLYDFYYGRASPILKFLIATAVGWLAGFGAYGLLLRADVGVAQAPPLAYLAAVLTTAVFHLRYIRTQREFLITRHPWRDFWIAALGETVACLLVSKWVAMRAHGAHAAEVFVIAFGAATVARYVLRKEFLQDIRGLRREARTSHQAAVADATTRPPHPESPPSTMSRICDRAA